VGLYDYRARWYEPTLGRFVQPDTLVPEPGKPQDLNRYTYVRNNPLKYQDPSGHQCTRTYDPLTNTYGEQECFGDKTGMGRTLAVDWGEEGAGRCAPPEECAAAMREMLLLLGGIGAASIAAPLLAEVVATLGLFKVGTTAGEVAAPACADGDCMNETQAVGEAVTWVNQTVPQGARLVSRWGPYTGEGPLGKEMAATFRGGSYSELVLTEDAILYRVYGGNAQQLSSWWSRPQPRGPLQSRIDFALLPEWGNTAEKVTVIFVPKGTMIYEGFAASQAGLVGGGSQTFVRYVDPAWIIK